MVVGTPLGEDARVVAGQLESEHSNQMAESSRRLAKASRFLELAKAEEGREVERFVDFLETVIESGRSVTWILQKEFARAPGFEAWYADQQRQMQADPLMRFFADVRTYTVHKGALTVRRVVSVTPSPAIAYVETSVTVKVIRARPWYGRPLAVTWGDLKANVLQWLRMHQPRLNAWWWRRQRARQVEVPAVVEDHYYFQDPGFDDRSAVALVEKYLTRLRPIVEAAERRFGEPPG